MRLPNGHATQCYNFFYFVSCFFYFCTLIYVFVWVFGFFFFLCVLFFFVFFRSIAQSENVDLQKTVIVFIGKKVWGTNSITGVFCYYERCQWVHYYAKTCFPTYRALARAHALAPCAYIHVIELVLVVLTCKYHYLEYGEREKKHTKQRATILGPIIGEHMESISMEEQTPFPEFIPAIEDMLGNLDEEQQHREKNMSISI